MRDQFNIRLASFRPSLRPMATSLAWIFVPLLVLLVAVSAFQGLNPLRLAGPAAIFAVSPMLVWLLVQMMGLVVYQEGVSGRTYWGRRAQIPWREITSLRFDGSSGIRFLVIEASSDSPSLYTLPDVVANAEFQRLANAHCEAWQSIFETVAD